MFYSNFTMSRHSEMRSSAPKPHSAPHRSADFYGLQSRELEAREDSVAWERAEHRKRKDAENDDRLGEIEIDLDDLAWLEEYGVPENFKEIYHAFFKIVGRHELQLEPVMEADARLENAGS